MLVRDFKRIVEGKGSGLYADVRAGTGSLPPEQVVVPFARIGNIGSVEVLVAKIMF